MKNFLTAVMALVAFGLSAAAQYNITTLMPQTTNIVATEATSNYTAKATLTKYEDVALYIACKMHAGATDSNVLFTIGRSIDGTTATVETRNRETIYLPLNGTTTVSIITNLPNTYIGSAGYLHLLSIGNGSTNTITNIVFNVITKPKRFGN